jgi:GH18 family chitinase
VGDIRYNGLDTIRKKTALAARKGGGIMIWELSQDTGDATSLLKAIREAAPGG